VSLLFPDDLTPGGPDDFFLAAEELLQTAADAVATTRGGPIARVYVSAGPPAFDCTAGGQLTVHGGAAQAADTLPLQPMLQPAQRIEYGIQVNLVHLTVTVIRCATVVGQSAAVPSAGKLAADAAVSLADLWAIWNFVFTRKRAGLLFGPLDERRELAMDPATPVQTSGGAMGWQIPFRVELSGYQIAGGS
jgi:hypothetical protein